MQTDRRLLQRALLSVTFHADGHRRSGVMRPLPLAEALNIIFHCDDHPIERTRWALQKLTKKELHSDLQAQVLDTINRAKMPALARVCHGGDASKARSRATPNRARSLNQVRDRFQAETAEAACTFDVGPCRTEFDSATGTVKLESESTVHKPIGQCLAMLDPRNWGRCSPHFDPTKTYEIKLDAQRRPLRDRKGELLKGSSSPIGEPWNGLLRECFDGEGISVENILQIAFAIQRDTRGEVARVEMTYSLYACERSQLGFLSELGGLRKNSGSMTGVPAGADRLSTRVTVTKTVRYQDFTPGNPGRFFDLGESLNVWASVLLCARADSEAVFNLCCNP